MIRAAQPGDEAALEAFLARHPETSMFLRSNLRDFGLAGAEHPRATQFWMLGNPLSGVLGLTKGGFLLIQAPDATIDELTDFAAVLKGRRVVGVTGDPMQVDALRAALGLDGRAMTIDKPEPLYRLSLSDLRDPGVAAIRPATEADAQLLLDWMLDYDVSTLGASATDATRARIKANIPREIAAGRTRLMIEDGRPVAKTGFNAALPDMVQIGGVYTPPDLRGRGYARRVVAAHLNEAAAQGVTSAILFSSGLAACRAYEAIGFERIGAYALALLKEPAVVGKAE